MAKAIAKLQRADLIRIENLFKNGEMKIIEIDTSKLPQNIKFHKDLTVFDEDDTDFKGLWTKDKIPPVALRLKE